jgi:hypothetical protein
LNLFVLMRVKESITKAARAITPTRSNRILPFISIVELESDENDLRVTESFQSIGYIRYNDTPLM